MIYCTYYKDCAIGEYCDNKLTNETLAYFSRHNITFQSHGYKPDCWRRYEKGTN